MEESLSFDYVNKKGRQMQKKSGRRYALIKSEKTIFFIIENIS